MKKASSDRAQSLARQVAGECIATRCRHLGRIVTALYDSALRPHGVTVSQFGLIVAIEQMAPVLASELTRVIDVEKSTLSRNIGLMSERGWLQIEAEGREKRLSLSRAGKDLLEAVFPAWEHAQAAARERLGNATVETLDKLLKGS